MYKIGYLGNFETVPQVVEYIINSIVLFYGIYLVYE